MSAARIMSLRLVLENWDGLVEDWGLDASERHLLLGQIGDGPLTEFSTYELPRVEARMRLIVELASVLQSTFGSTAKICAWLRRPNLNLGDRTPIEMMGSSPEWIRWLIAGLGAAS